MTTSVTGSWTVQPARSRFQLMWVASHSTFAGVITLSGGAVDVFYSPSQHGGCTYLCVCVCVCVCVCTAIISASVYILKRMTIFICLSTYRLPTRYTDFCKYHLVLIPPFAWIRHVYQDHHHRRRQRHHR